MFKKIKAILVKKIVLSKLNEKNLLKLFKYYKKYQNKITILSGKYIISENNGKFKEYDIFNDEIIYYGEYSDGKRNWKGKEYKYGYFIFEGEYLNGKRNGKGKEYYNRKIIFEGEYLNGKRWNGKAYDNSNNIIYELKDGKGFIKNCEDDICIFEGEYLNGEKNGKGKEYNKKGNLLFEGEYLRDKRHGQGKEYYPNGNILFEGEYYYDHRLKGKEYYLNGKIEFEGEYSDSKWNGKGYNRSGKLLY